jgi:hypothetical protein
LSRCISSSHSSFKGSFQPSPLGDSTTKNIVAVILQELIALKGIGISGAVRFVVRDHWHRPARRWRSV